MQIKTFILTAVLATAVLCFAATPASAMTSEEINTMIAQLQAQIQSLMQQIAALQDQQAPPQEWCHTFNKNIGYANSGNPEVGYLHTALDKEGISYAPDTGNMFGKGTMSAVSEFQEKYASEILVRYRLRRGTGYVGVSTRAKLNQLYGCEKECRVDADCPPINCFVAPCPINRCIKGKCVQVDPPSITVTSPNGGETWKIGETHNITWTSIGLPLGVNASVYIGINGDGQTSTMAGGQIVQALASAGSYPWTIPSFLGENLAGKKYQVYVTYSSTDGNLVGDTSDNYFTIAAAETSCETDMDCWDSTGPASRCISGVCVPMVTQNLFINGQSSNGPVIVNSGSSATLTWTSSNATSCVASSCFVSDSILITGACPAGNSDDPLWSGVVTTSGAKTTSPITQEIVYGLTCTGPSGDSPNNSLGARPSTTQPSITVTSPNGGESWQAGSQQEIKWKTENLPVSLSEFTVRLRSEAGVEYYGLIYVGGGGGGTAIGNTYGFYYKVPTTINPGKYKAEVKTSLNGQSYLDASDNYFVITAETCAPSWQCTGWTECVDGTQTRNCFDLNYCGSTATKPIEKQRCASQNLPPVISSVSGPTSLLSGQNGTWTVNATDPNGDALTYRVQWGNSMTQELSSVNTFTHSFTPGPTYANPTQYQNVFYVKDSAGNEARKDVYVSVLRTDNPSITVTSPNGGETWKGGEARDILWQANNIGTVNIELTDVSYTGHGLSIASNVNASSGKYTWNIPSNVYPGQYKVRINSYLTATGGISDSSNSNFSIVSAVSPSVSAVISNSAIASIADALARITQAVKNLLGQ